MSASAARRRMDRDLDERRAIALPDRPERRSRSSLANVARRYVEVERADKARDVSALRYELRELSVEAARLAEQDVIT